MNAAHPFMLITVQSGNEKLDTRLLTPARDSMFCIVKGNVAFDDFEKKAMLKAGDIALNARTGEMPFHFNNNGNTTTP